MIASTPVWIIPDCHERQFLQCIRLVEFMDMVWWSWEFSKEFGSLHRANTDDLPVKRMMVCCEPFSGTFRLLVFVSDIYGFCVFLFVEGCETPCNIRVHHPWRLQSYLPPQSQISS